MKSALELILQLNKKDADWFMSQGCEEQVIIGHVVIKEGEIPEFIFFILEGLLGVRASNMDDAQFRILGPGEMIGDMSLLEGVQASVSVVATENSLLLAIPKSEIFKRLEFDEAFAARFYKALAIINSRRLRDNVGFIGNQIKEKATFSDHAEGIWSEISENITKLKDAMDQAETEALKNDDEIPEELKKAIEAGFYQFSRMITEKVNRNSDIPESIKTELGRKIKLELLPYLLLTENAERFYSKPRGYAGDFLSIEMMYKNEAKGKGRLGPLFDRCFLNEPAAKAVQNRRGLLIAEINRVLEAHPDKPARICSMASGPAAEIFDTYEKLENPSRMLTTLIDIDLQALAYVTEKAQKKKLKRQIVPINANLVYLAIGRQQVDVVDQHLVYSIGLIDYFADKFVIALLNYIHKILLPGGKVILGNFHPENPSKALMDYVLDWKLIHRSEEDMNRLFEQSLFKSPCTELKLEEAKVNLFASCIKKNEP